MSNNAGGKHCKPYLKTRFSAQIEYGRHVDSKQQRERIHSTPQEKYADTQRSSFFQRGRGQLGDSATEATDSTFSGKTLFVNAVQLALLFWLL